MFAATYHVFLCNSSLFASYLMNEQQCYMNLLLCKSSISLTVECMDSSLLHRGRKRSTVAFQTTTEDVSSAQLWGKCRELGGFSSFSLLRLIELHFKHLSESRASDYVAEQKLSWIDYVGGLGYIHCVGCARPDWVRGICHANTPSITLSQSLNGVSYGRNRSSYPPCQ